MPPLPPVDVETKAVLKATIEARAALSTLTERAARIPNAGVLVSTVVLREAKLSSAIENIVTTDDQLYRAAVDAGKGADPFTKEVLRYREALWSGYKLLQERPLSTNLFIELASILKDAPMDIRKIPGTRLAGAGGAVVYTPPQGESLIRQKLSDLERFIHADDDLDHLVRLALIHYQFEAIHPFRDGNGRSGRIVNILYLVEKGLLDLPVLFLSGFILKHRSEYYRLLRGVTSDGLWEPWILYVLKAIEETAKETSFRIERIIDVIGSTGDLIRTQAPQIYSRVLVEALFVHPYCRIHTLEQAGVARRITASRYLSQLAEMGVLSKKRVGRDLYYLNELLLDILSSDHDY